MARRKTAKHATAYVAGVKIADLYGLKFSISTGSEDSSAFDDDFEMPEPTKGKWTGSAKRYVSTGATTFMNRAVATPTQTTPSRLIAYDGAGVKVFEGDCWFESSDWDMDNASLIKDDVTILGYGTPVFVI